MKTLRQSSEAPRSTEARLQGRFRSQLYQLLGIGALTLGVTACNGGETDNGTGGQAAEGGGGTGGVGGTGGSNPCEGLELGAIAEVEVSPGEIKEVTVNLGDSNPDKVYNNLSLQINGDILDESGLALLIAKTDVNVNSGYELTDMKGFITTVVDPKKPWILNSDGNCERNPLMPNAGMNDINKQPIVTYPLALSALRVETGEDTLEDFELTAQGVRTNISELNGEGYYLANSKPVVTTNVTRDPDGHILLDLTGTTDEGDGSNLVLENLGVMASDGLVFAAVSGQPGKFRSVESSNLGSFTAYISGLAEGPVDDTTSVNASVSCEGINTNDNGTCSEGLVTCNPGFANDDADYTNNCDGCDTESGLYENDYPLCSPDVTPPSAPVITTNGGENTIIFQANYTLDGITGADTHEMWYNIDGGGFSKINSYVANAPAWSYNGNIPNVLEFHDYCFLAKDKAGNPSITDCINVERFP